MADFSDVEEFAGWVAGGDRPHVALTPFVEPIRAVTQALGVYPIQVRPMGVERQFWWVALEFATRNGAAAVAQAGVVGRLQFVQSAGNWVVVLPV